MQIEKDPACKVENVVIVSGGMAEVAITSATVLAKKGIHIIFFSAISPIDRRLLDSKNITVICLNLPPLTENRNKLQASLYAMWNPVAKREFEKLLEKLPRGKTVIHFHSWFKVLSCALFEVASRYDFPVFITAHDYFCFCPNGAFFNYPKRKNCCFRPMSFCCMFCNCDSRSYLYKIWRLLRQAVSNRYLWKNKNITFITISNLNNRLYRQNLPGEYRTERIDNPIRMPNRPLVNVGVNHAYLYVGRISPEKGVDLFCGALSELNLPGIVIGDGPLKEELQKRYQRIHFTGWLSPGAMEPYLYQAKALVFPSLVYEGAPLTVLEMQSYGLPSIVSDSSSAKDDVSEGKTGFIFKSNDIESLKKSIQKMEISDCSAIQEVILKNMNREQHSVNRHVCQLMEAYQSSLERKIG